MGQDVAAKVHALLEPAVMAAGYELVEAQWKHEPGGWVVRLLIDTLDSTDSDPAQAGERGETEDDGLPPASGVGLSDCERVSREVAVLLDVHDVVPHAYSLEVSSPGLDRPLLKPSHFRRFLGQRAKVKLRGGVDGRRNFTGTIIDADAAKIRLEVDGTELKLPVDDLERGQLVFELPRHAPGTASKPGKVSKASKEGK